LQNERRRILALRIFSTMKESAGTLLYRRAADGVELLLVHASGNYNRHAPWSIPKGLPDEREDLEAAARRETLEETGVAAAELVPLGSVQYVKSRKRIHAFAGEVPRDVSPHCASWEVDRAQFVSLEQARTLLHPDQRPLLDRLEKMLSQQ
jgi:predicted NUDIX family NTP pyrophosphohydrolase